MPCRVHGGRPIAVGAMGGLRETVARLAAGSHGRTEADIQIGRPEVPARRPPRACGRTGRQRRPGGTGRGRPGGLMSRPAARRLKSRRASRQRRLFEDAVIQLARYVKQRAEALSQRYVGILTDGQTGSYFHLRPSGDLAEVSRFRLTGGEDAARLAAWLEPVLATTDKITPTPKEIVRRLGADSPAARLDLADLHALYATCWNHPEVQLKRELWARLLRSALGTNFENSDELFVNHTLPRVGGRVDRTRGDAPPDRCSRRGLPRAARRPTVSRSPESMASSRPTSSTGRRRFRKASQ